jgi:phosphate starvation-inducible protein PhoH
MGGKTLPTGNVLLEEHHSITCKLCKAKFESLGDMQRHVVTEHFQKGDLPEEKKEEK